MPDHKYDLVVTNEIPPADWSGTTGVVYIPQFAGLEKHPVAVSERGHARGQRDHVHLAVFDGTMLAQWWGRASDGRHHPHGQIMKIVPASVGGHPHG
jgi:hypothetical protein